MSKIRAIFMGTPEIARGCLESIARDPQFEIVGVVSQPDRPAGRKMQLTASPVKALAQQLGLPVLTPERASEPAEVAVMKSWQAEIVVVVAFGQILKTNLLESWPGRVVNLHASLLPRWRGAAPMQRALMAGDRESGVCLQVMAKKLDAGPVFGTRVIKLPTEMTASDLFAESERLGKELLTTELVAFARGEAVAIAQDESRVTFAPKIEKAEARLDFSKSAGELHNHVRGLTMGPTAWMKTPNKRVLKIHRTRVLSEENSVQDAGQVVRADAGGLVIQCGLGQLEILEIQPESRTRVTAAEFVRGQKFLVGDTFGTTGPEIHAH